MTEWRKWKDRVSKSSIIKDGKVTRVEGGGNEQKMEKRSMEFLGYGREHLLLRG